MGLRSDLQDLLDLQALTGQFQEATGGLRQQAAQQVLNQQAPDLISQGNFGEVAGLAGQAGQPQLQTGIIEKLIAQKTAAAKPGQIPLTRAQIVANLPAELQTNEELVNSLEKAPLSAQLQLLKAQQTGYNQGENRKVSVANLGERKTQAIQGQRGAASKVLDEALKPYEEDDKNLTKIKAAFDKNTNTGDSLAMVYIAKVIGGQSGVLTDKDIDRMLGPSFGMKVNELKNYLSGGNETILTPAQRQSLREVIQLAQENNKTFRARDFQKSVQDQIVSNPRLIKDGKIDPSIADRAKREGYTVGLDAEGNVQVRAGKRSSSATGKGLTNEGQQQVDVTPLSAKAGLLRNPKIKAFADAEISKVKTQEAFDRINAKLDELLKGK